MSKRCICPAVLHYRAASACRFPALPAATVSNCAFGRSLPLFCPRPWLIRHTTTYLLASSFQRKRKLLWLRRRQPLTQHLLSPGPRCRTLYRLRAALGSMGWAPPQDLYQPHYSGSGNQWSGYASSSPAVPMPSVLVRPGASDGQLLDGLSLLAPDIRQRLLTILHAMEHRQVGQARVVLASPPGPPPDAPPQSRPGRNPPLDPAPKRRAFPEAQDFCTIACRVPGCDRLCGRPLTPRGHRNHVCRRCHRHRQFALSNTGGAATGKCAALRPALRVRLDARFLFLVSCVCRPSTAAIFLQA